MTIVKVNNLSSSDNGLIKLASLNVASGSAGTSAVKIDGVFSSTYDQYQLYFDLRSSGNTTISTTLGVIFGNGGTLHSGTKQVRGSSIHKDYGSAAVGNQYYSSNNNVHQVMGSGASEPLNYSGSMVIHYPNSSTHPTVVNAMGTMWYGSTELSKWTEYGSSSEDVGDILQSTDIKLCMIKDTSSTGAGNVTQSSTQYAVYGNLQVFGVPK